MGPLVQYDIRKQPCEDRDAEKMHTKMEQRLELSGYKLKNAKGLTKAWREGRPCLGKHRKAMVWQVSELKQQEMEYSHHEEKQGLRRQSCEHSLWSRQHASSPESVAWSQAHCSWCCL